MINTNVYTPPLNDNNMKNLVNTLFRFKLSSSLNIIGLSLSFVAFIMIMIQVNYEFSAGKDDPRYKNIYRLQSKNQDDTYGTIQIPKPVIERFISSTPQIEAYANFQYSNTDIITEDDLFKNVPSLTLRNDISELFKIDMIDGMFSSALEPNNAVICESLAKRLFKGKSALGQKISMNNEYTITGIYKDFPENSALPNGVYSQYYEGGFFSALYCLLPQDVDVPQIIHELNKPQNKELTSYSQEYDLIPIKDTYFNNQFINNSFIKRGNRTTTILMFSVSMLVIIIALINFINFTMALAPIRVKSLNTRTVFGCPKSTHIRNIIVEAILFCLISYILALFWMELIKNTSIIELLKTSNSDITSNLGIIGGTAIMAVLLGGIAGVYPALYCTSFNPAVAIKGELGLSSHGGVLRNILIGFQFTTSIALIAISIFIYQQNYYLNNTDLGYNKDNIIELTDIDLEKAKIVTERARELSSLKNITTYNGSFGKYDGDMVSDLVINDDTISVIGFFISDNFMDFMEIPIIKGRGFLPSDITFLEYSPAKDNEEKFINIIVNETALKAFNATVGSNVKDFHIIGVVNDVVTHPMYTAVQPTLYLKHKYLYTTAMKVEGKNSLDAMQDIKKIVKSIEPTESWSLSFYDQTLASFYEKERDLSKLITIFSLLAIMISLMGVFGMVVFDTQHRRKEIAIRKINGATCFTILKMLNSKFVKINMVCFVLAVPFVLWVVNEWLKNFAYHISLSWWVFLVSLLIVVTITILIVTVQSMRVASENPINSMKE